MRAQLDFPTNFRLDGKIYEFEDRQVTKMGINVYVNTDTFENRLQVLVDKEHPGDDDGDDVFYFQGSSYITHWYRKEYSCKTNPLPAPLNVTDFIASLNNRVSFGKTQLPWSSKVLEKYQVTFQTPLGKERVMNLFYNRKNELEYIQVDGQSKFMEVVVCVYDPVDHYSDFTPY